MTKDSRSHKTCARRDRRVLGIRIRISQKIKGMSGISSVQPIQWSEADRDILLDTWRTAPPQLLWTQWRHEASAHGPSLRT